MASRDDVFVNGYYYHVFNKNIDPLKIFNDDKALYAEFIDTFIYYRSDNSCPRFSLFKKMEKEIKDTKWIKIFDKSSFKVDILSFCLMSNHYHFLISQLKNNGIVSFMSNIINSLTRFYNIKNERKGPIFLPQFKSRRIYSIEQLVYTSRYIHTNPYADETVKEKNEIFSYPYSSIKAFMRNGKNRFKINTDVILDFFNNDSEDYKDFILKNAEDQKMREIVKYTEKWSS